MPTWQWPFVLLFPSQDFERGLGEVRVKCVASLYDVYYKVAEVVVARVGEQQEQEQEEEEPVFTTSEKSHKGKHYS